MNLVEWVTELSRVSAVLAVDDDSDFSVTLAELLVNSNVFRCRLTTTESGQDAIRLFRQFSYDLVFLDYYLSDASWMDLFCKFKEIRRECPVLVVANGTTTMDEMDFIRLQGADIIHKPEDFTLDRLKPILNGFRIQPKLFSRNQEAIKQCCQTLTYLGT